MKISIILEALTGLFETDMNRASKTAQKRMKEIEKQAEKAGKVIGAALVAGATAAAVALKSAIDEADKLNEISSKIGIPTDVLSSLNYAAKMGGVATEELQGGLVKMVKFQEDAATGGKEAIKVFKTLGIEVKDSSGHLRNSADLFQEFAEIFKNLPDGPEKTALALRVFGKSGAELIPVLNEGKQGLKDMADELESLGGVIDPVSAKLADQFNDNVDKAKQAIYGLAWQVAEDLLPDLIKLQEQFLDTATEGDNVKESAHDVAEMIRWVAESAVWLNDSLDALIANVMGLFYAMKGLSELTLPGWLAHKLSGAEDTDNFGMAGALFDQSAAAVAPKVESSRPAGFGKGIRGGKPMQLGKPFVPDISGLFVEAEKAGKKATKEVDKLGEAYERMKAQMAETIALFGQTSEAAKVRYDLEHGELAKLSDEKKKELIQQAEKIDALNAEKEVREKMIEIDEAEMKAAEQHRKDIAQLIDDIKFETSLLSLNNDEREKAIVLRQANASAATAEGQQILDALDKRQSMEKQIEGMDALREAGRDLFVDLLDGTGTWQDAFNAAIDNIRMRLLQLIAERLIEKLFGADGTSQTGSAGGGGWFNTLISAFFGSGSSTSSSSSGAGMLGWISGGYADGTDSAPGGLAWVGERGRELVNLPKGSQVIPNHKLGSLGGNTTNISVNVDGRTDRDTAQDVARRVARELAFSVRAN